MPSLLSLVLTLVLPLATYSTPITAVPVVTNSNANSLTVDSKLLWNPSKTFYKSGMKLHFEADPQAVWYDVNKKIETTADGYTNIGVTMRYNVSNDNIMAMICCMNNSMKNCANVGSNGDLLLTEDGFVSCFANDNPATYGNNFGSIVTEISVV
jgi:hypothetical protein